jgi:hypothetical protein
VDESPPSEEQQEELEALAAIFGDEYSLLSDPLKGCPQFSIALREQGSGGAAAEGEDAASGPTSRLFSITFNLPRVGVPASCVCVR